jgi:hypothetical protein
MGGDGGATRGTTTGAANDDVAATSPTCDNDNDVAPLPHHCHSHSPHPFLHTSCVGGGFFYFVFVVFLFIIHMPAHSPACEGFTLVYNSIIMYIMSV